MARQMKDSGIEWIGEIPEGWSVSKVKYFIDCYDGRRVPVDAGERVSGPYPYWGAGSITDYVDKYLFDEELILLGEDGAPFFDPTRPVAFLVNEKVWVNNHIHVLKPHADVCPAYLLHFLNTVDYKTYINGSILNKLTQSNMNGIAFIVPSILEQHRIADFLDRRCAEIDAVIERTKATIEEYKKLKQAVITEAVTKGVRGPRKMKDSGIEWIGEIPEEWEVSRVKYVSDFEPSSRRDDLKEESIITYTPMDCIKNGWFINNTATLGSVSSSLTAYQEGDIVLAKVTPCFENGNIAIMKGLASGFGLGSSELFVIRTVSIDTKYMFYWLRNERFIQRACATMTGTGGLKRVSPAFVKNCFIHVPPATEQAEISAYLDEKCAALDTLIAKKTALLTELETYKKSLIYEYVTGKKEV